MRIPHPVDGLGAFDPWAQTEEEEDDEDKDEGAAGASEENGGAYTFTDPSTGEKFSTLSMTSVLFPCVLVCLDQ